MMYCHGVNKVDTDKSQEVRRHAQNAVISLYNLNPPKVTMILAELPKYYQVRYCIEYFCNK